MVFHVHSEGILEGSPKWCKGLHLQMKEYDELIVSWGLHQVAMHSWKLSGGDKQRQRLKTKCVFSFKGVTGGEDQVSFIYANKKLLNFAAASSHGALRIWKLSDKMTLLHNFDRLARPIVDIQAHPKEDSYFIAGCMDCRIRVYDQRKSELIYTFDLPDGISLFKFVTKTHFAINLPTGEMQICKMNFPAKILLTSQ